ncbi:MAG: Maf family protein [Patescibacteria group bacterium]
MKKVILASTSPRRKDILSKTLIPFEIQESSYEEDMTLDMPAEELAEFLSAGKARAVAAANTDAIIIAADTFVVYQHHRLGKPKTPERAKEMLEMLSGKQHEIVTGVTIIGTESGKEVSFHEATKVMMATLSPEIIEAYIQTGEPLGMAGAYALQETGALLVEKIEGDFFNAMGLPLRRLVKELEAFGVKAL